MSQHCTACSLLLTAPHVPCGLAGADGRDALRLVDDQTFETLDRFTLDAYELTCSLTSLQFAEDPKWYYVMGTAYAHPDEDEPSKVSDDE